MSSRNSYHTTIKLAYALDIQNAWLPLDFRKSIPRSTTYYWKREEKEKFVGYEFASSVSDNVEDLKLIYDDRVKREKQLFITYTRIKLTLIQVFTKPVIQKAFREHFRTIVKLVQSSTNVVGDGMLCKFLDIKKHTYRYWESVATHRCEKSVKGLCLRKVPNQATWNEVDTIRRLLRRKRFEHWPICSVWGYAMRKGHVSLSLSSWYRYNKIFQFRRTNRKGKFKRKYIPLRAPQPNHTWHADITVFKTLDNVKHYIYLIVDNYSKFILNYRVASACNGKIRAETIRQTIKEQFGEDDHSEEIDLIVDGGSENNNQTVHQFIRKSHVDINKKVALMDIVQSNSMVEASNKILKHRYLFLKPLANGQQLKEHLQEAVFDFCFRRPHYALGPFTPFEIHYGQKPQLNPDQINNAVKERRRTNQNDYCRLDCK